MTGVNFWTQAAISHCKQFPDLPQSIRDTDLHRGHPKKRLYANEIVLGEVHSIAQRVSHLFENALVSRVIAPGLSANAVALMVTPKVVATADSFRCSGELTPILFT